MSGDNWLDDWNGPDLGSSTDSKQEFDEEVRVSYRRDCMVLGCLSI